MKSWSLSKNKRMKKNKSKKIDRHKGNKRVSLFEIISGGYHIHKHQNNMSVEKRQSKERRNFLVLYGVTSSTTVAWYCQKIPRAKCQYPQKKGKVQTMRQPGLLRLSWRVCYILMHVLLRPRASHSILPGDCEALADVFKCCQSIVPHSLTIYTTYVYQFI